MANKPSDVAADNVRDNTSNNNELSTASAKGNLKQVSQAYKLLQVELDAAKADVKVLGVVVFESTKQLTRPTPGMLRACTAVFRAYTTVVREMRGYVGSLTAALPALSMALSDARDAAGAYSLDVIEAASNELLEEATRRGMVGLWDDAKATSADAEVGATGYLDQVPFEGDTLVKGTDAHGRKFLAVKVRTARGGSWGRGRLVFFQRYTERPDFWASCPSHRGSKDDLEEDEGVSYCPLACGAVTPEVEKQLRQLLREGVVEITDPMGLVHRIELE